VNRKLAAAFASAVLLAGGALLALANHTPSKRPPRPPLVIVLILDELPLDSLLGPEGRIDALRYPNFARLAATSNWYENATTVYDSTFKAVPGILDARLPKKGSVADARSHPRNIYTLFDGLGYKVVDVESAGALCVPSICPGHRTRRPGVIARLRGGGRPARLHRWIRSIRPRSHRTLYVQHTLLPHEPWIYLPSGHQSRPAGLDPVQDVNNPGGFHDPDLSLHNQASHLLQLGYVDRELGILMAHLERHGLFDKALLVVTADHGYAFHMGIRDRRQVRPSNIDLVAPVPLFVKRPGQRAGLVNSEYVHNIDIVPTLADVLGVRLDWSHDGRSLLRPRPPTREVSMTSRDFKNTVKLDSRTIELRRRGWREHWAHVFLTGAESKARYGHPFAGVYRVGPNTELLDRPVGQDATAPDTARVANKHLWRDVSRSRKILPTRVAGELLGHARAGVRRDLAAAVNGRIRAVGRSFYLNGDSREWFSLMVPEGSLRDGPNEVELFQVLPRGRLLRLG
jgi:hypothetical protein